MTKDELFGYWRAESPPTIEMPNLVLLKDFLPPFRIGATVRLKSGGPVMTVTAIIDGHAETQWFEKTGAKQKIYPIGALSPAKRKKNDPPV
jgi:uncharacterized protein YodC (DUF2158 family)